MSCWCMLSSGHTTEYFLLLTFTNCHMVSLHTSINLSLPWQSTCFTAFVYPANRWLTRTCSWSVCVTESVFSNSEYHSSRKPTEASHYLASHVTHESSLTCFTPARWGHTCTDTLSPAPPPRGSDCSGSLRTLHVCPDCCSTTNRTLSHYFPISQSRSAEKHTDCTHYKNPS